MSSLIGQSLGRYHILEQLGEGGMAVVYKAYDTRLESDVAVKVIRTENLAPSVLARALKRFEREAKALAKLTHANIVKVLDYGEYEGRPYLVMPFLPGGTLKECLKGQTMPWQEAARLLLPVARALDFAHQEGLIHRDVKPSNILITRSGDPMLTDFGIAKIIDEETTLDLTGTSAAVGTPEYMAPEQATSKSVDHRADIYALGIVLYETLTGRKPYTADTPMAVMIMHARDPLPRPTQFVPGLPDGVEKLLIKSLAKKPEDRYQSMGEFAAALEGLLSGAPAAAKAAQRAAPKPASEVQRPVTAPASTLSTRLDAAPSRPQPSATENRKSSIQPWLPWAVGGGVLVGVLVLGLILAAALLGGSGLFQPQATDTPRTTSTPRATSTPFPSSTPRATSTPSLGIGSTWERPKDGMTMLYIPAGEFEMGSDADEALAECRKHYDGCERDWFTNEEPIHTVYLDAYWMDETEVTNGMYALCVQAGACQPPSDKSSYTRNSYYGNSQYEIYPVIYVNWDQARTYCKWAGARLPTEAEWEKAARGTDGRMYPWGDVFDARKVNFCDKNCPFDWANKNADDGYADTSPVGSFVSGKSPYGLYDMAGNVWEWAADWYDSGYYANSPSRNPTGLSSGEYRVLRGGSWLNNEDVVRTAVRDWVDPSDVDGLVGFRCSRGTSP
jgi:serine/threonine-protein kinase